MPGGVCNELELTKPFKLPQCCVIFQAVVLNMTFEQGSIGLGECKPSDERTSTGNEIKTGSKYSL